jgi:hypothetical protein
LRPLSNSRILAYAEGLFADERERDCDRVSVCTSEFLTGDRISVAPLVVSAHHLFVTRCDAEREISFVDDQPLMVAHAPFVATEMRILSAVLIWLQALDLGVRQRMLIEWDVKRWQLM